MWTDLKKEEASRIQLARDRDNLRAAVNLRVLSHEENLLTGWGTISFSRATLLHCAASLTARRTLPSVISISGRGQAYSSSLPEVWWPGTHPDPCLVRNQYLLSKIKQPERDSTCIPIQAYVVPPEEDLPFHLFYFISTYILYILVVI
jgi:hypothetical protein